MFDSTNIAFLFISQKLDSTVIKIIQRFLVASITLSHLIKRGFDAEVRQRYLD